MLSPRDFGARGDGTADDTAALVQWIDAIPAGGRAIMPPGVYCCSAPLVLDRPLTLDAWGATLQWTGGAGVALTIGATSGAYLSGVNVFGLHVKYRTAPDWSTAATGWLIRNVAYSLFHGVGAGEFATGLDLVGDGQGVAHNDFLFRVVANNQMGLRLRQVNAGWVNQNRFSGGAWFQGVTPSGPQTHVAIDGRDARGGAFNGLSFNQCSFEALTSTTTLARVDGVNSAAFLQCRAESGDGSDLPFVIGPTGSGVLWDGAALDRIDWQDGNPHGGNVRRSHGASR